MYPYDFEPTLKGLNPEEIFIVMPFAVQYDPVFTDLVEPAVHLAGRDLGRMLEPYRTKGDRRTTSGWLEVLEHLFTAQVVLGVLTKRVNANVHYELGIAHATQPIRRQILIAEGHYKPAFDTKDLIFMQYSRTSPANSVNELAERIKTAITEWDVEQEKIVSHAIAKITPFEFEVMMHWSSIDHFNVRTSGSGPDDYKKAVAVVHERDTWYMEGVFKRHCEAIGQLQHSGLLGFNTHTNPPQIEFTYYWTDLGNLIFVRFGIIDKAERVRRYGVMPRHLRRVS
jgi:hypothetical protein